MPIKAWSSDQSDSGPLAFLDRYLRRVNRDGLADELDLIRLDMHLLSVFLGALWEDVFEFISIGSEFHANSYEL